MTGPTQAGFNNFVRTSMGINNTVLPDNSPFLVWAFEVAIELVNRRIAQASTIMYIRAVYNLAADNLINYAQDTADAPPVVGSKPPLPFFANTRARLNINSFVTGVISSTSDEGTSESMVVPEAVRSFTIADLQNLKTPWGRAYIGIAQSVGSDWGLS